MHVLHCHHSCPQKVFVPKTFLAWLVTHVIPLPHFIDTSLISVQLQSSSVDIMPHRLHPYHCSIVVLSSLLFFGSDSIGDNCSSQSAQGSSCLVSKEYGCRMLIWKEFAWYGDKVDWLGVVVDNGDTKPEATKRHYIT